MRNRRTRVSFPVFNGYVVHVIEARDVSRTARRLCGDGGPCVAFFQPGERKGWLVIPCGADAGTIAHEASHAIQELFRWTGVKRDEEAYAYHLDFLVARIHKFLER